ncbi:MAG: hypothetical protein AT715_00210 [Thermoproteus sp. JCHS_4]|nr:MAG: hypothetical protein AT715_00210 [Thermoproteus sp. JCHS_4]
MPASRICLRPEAPPLQASYAIYFSAKSVTTSLHRRMLAYYEGGRDLFLGGSRAAGRAGPRGLEDFEAASKNFHAASMDVLLSAMEAGLR